MKKTLKNIFQKIKPQYSKITFIKNNSTLTTSKKYADIIIFSNSNENKGIFQ